MKSLTIPMIYIQCFFLVGVSGCDVILYVIQDAQCYQMRTVTRHGCTSILKVF